MSTNNNDNQFRTGHRSRLREKFLSGKLNQAERLELLLADVIPRRDVRILSRQLLDKFGNISQILGAPIDTLESVDGIGHVVALHLKLINEIMLDGYRVKMTETKVFHDAKLINDYCLTMLAGKQIEEMHVLYLDKDYRLLSDDTHSVGTLDWSPIYERDIVHRALNLNARVIIMVHNHPGGTATFSDEDVIATNKIRAMLEPLQIAFYDHYLVANGILYSMNNLHFIDKSK
ncbi:MAG: DNA repair protein RadC [Muribaculaceae bacterium]|nr:DNA repair protein RadC [Muribaculaceae bacterium]